jgi:hypothetical protein
MGTQSGCPFCLQINGYFTGYFTLSVNVRFSSELSHPAA